MSRYIDRDLTLAGIEDLKKSPWYNGCNGNYERLIRREAVDIVTELCIKQVPTADVVEVRHGKWLTWEEQFPDRKPTKKNSLGVFCNNCHSHADNMTDYCPNCGAKMDSDTNDEL